MACTQGWLFIRQLVGYSLHRSRLPIIVIIINNSNNGGITYTHTVNVVTKTTRVCNSCCRQGAGRGARWRAMSVGRCAFRNTHCY